MDHIKQKELNVKKGKKVTLFIICLIAIIICFVVGLSIGEVVGEFIYNITH